MGTWNARVEDPNKVLTNFNVKTDNRQSWWFLVFLVAVAGWCESVVSDGLLPLPVSSVMSARRFVQQEKLSENIFLDYIDNNLINLVLLIANLPITITTANS